MRMHLADAQTFGGLSALALLVSFGLATGGDSSGDRAPDASYPGVRPPAHTMRSPLGQAPRIPIQMRYAIQLAGVRPEPRVPPTLPRFPVALRPGARAGCPPVAAWPPADARRIAPAAAPPGKATMPPFQEAHWQGLEVIPRTPTLARRLPELV